MALGHAYIHMHTHNPYTFTYTKIYRQQSGANAESGNKELDLYRSQREENIRKMSLSVKNGITLVNL